MTELRVDATKRLKALLDNRLGVSPIFATLIILAIVTVLFIPVFMWATGTSSETEDFWEASGLVVTERVVIEEANIQSSDYCTIYVRNIGKTAVTIANILVTYPDGYIEPFNIGDFTVSPEYVTQGELITIENVPVTYSSGIFTIKVITPRGVSDTFQVVIEGI